MLIKLSDKERQRLEAMTAYEAEARAAGYRLVAGIDEAGRGPLAGPVVSAAVILPWDYWPSGLNDSKKLTEKTRERLYGALTREAAAWAVGIADETEIDEINILNATKNSMLRAVEALAVRPDYLLTDAVWLARADIPQRAIIKGDALSLSIAAASVIAKVTRDRLMTEYDAMYPQYGFAKHKGYGTSAHLDAIARYGLCPIHRKTFRSAKGGSDR